VETTRSGAVPRAAKAREHWHAPVGDRRSIDRLTDSQRADNREQAGLRALVEQAIAHLANAWALRRWRGCCTGPGTSSAPPARWFALAAGYTESPHDPSITDTLNETGPRWPFSLGRVSPSLAWP
jgi:hypothetical protein